MTDTAADWLKGGHLGKTVTVGMETAIVTSNTETELTLAPARPGAKSSWKAGNPPKGSPYSLPDCPAERPGIAIAAATDRTTKRGNRAWDSQQPRHQTHGMWITEQGSCHESWVTDNNFLGNLYGGTRFDTAPDGGYWRDNLGFDKAK